MKRIGKKIEGINYKKREAVYAIIERKEDKKVAIASANGYFFLFGGGIEKGEDEIEALKREMLEETGYTIYNIQYFDKVTSWADGIERGPLDVTATCYLVQLDQKVAEPIEQDHEILWVEVTEYKDKLYNEYQRYFLEEYKAFSTSK